MDMIERRDQRIVELEARVNDLMEGLRRADERENNIKNEAADFEDERDDVNALLDEVAEWAGDSGYYRSLKRILAKRKGGG